MALLLEKLVVLALLVFYDFLGFDLHVDELALVLIYLITNLLFAKVIQLLVLDADERALHMAAVCERQQRPDMSRADVAISQGLLDDDGNS